MNNAPSDAGAESLAPSAANVNLRAATPADAAQIAEILILARLAFMPYAPSAHTQNEVQAWAFNQLVPSGVVTVAESNGEVIGVMALSRELECSWITQMYVHPSRVGRGIGATLLAHAMAKLSPPVRLHTFQANTKARRFYERHGFVAIAFSDGSSNEERCPDVLYEHAGVARAIAKNAEPLPPSSPM